MAHRRILAQVIITFVAALALNGCGEKAPAKPATQVTPDRPPEPKPVAQPINILFAYGSEKEAWINEVTTAFNADLSKTVNGKKIIITAKPMGSGECIDDVLSGKIQAHIVSPASGAFIKLGNTESRVKTGKDLVPSTENLVVSPVVIAMWKPMAEAIGWGKKPVGWAEIFALSRAKGGWADYGKAQWGQFKFGHTHPQYSNSGLISIFAETYAGASKMNGLTLDDLKRPEVIDFVKEIEHSVVHYGSSTGFFGKKMFSGGPEYLSAAVLYENMVIEANAPNNNLPFPVVALYPKEGTFWSDHPAGVVDREWVSADHRAAAKLYLSYLLELKQQEKALAYGFRPSTPEIKLAAPFDADHGVDPMQPQTTLEVPSPEVMNGIVKMWEASKKHSNIVLVVDVSGSMKIDGRLIHARSGAQALIDVLHDNDSVSLLAFDNRLMWADRDIVMKDGRTRIKDTINSLIPGGETALYDAVNAAYTHLETNPQPGKISAVVVLTDGEDNKSRIPLDALLAKLSPNEKTPIRVFTIAYGKGASKAVLKKIADTTQAKFYEGTTENIGTVFKDISTFF